MFTTCTQCLIARQTQFYGSYIIQAIEEDQYFFLRGCNADFKDGVTLIMLRQRCLDENMKRKLSEVVEDLGVPFEDFIEDPVEKKECSQ
ncbi:hypothetical protein L9F63_002665 [Diploptera punctata]|uniref:Uncharacterized protein n=1 Tax=Diploptera punctata TaxID=6984 RepID=A0AAD7ZTG4_DIPPU|nr:hypothetical protein L9F63_002665 [Diploptera punctata]